MVCSDGLSGLVRDAEIARIVQEERDLRAVCNRLIATANERGGPDNITVVVAEFEGPGLAEAISTDEIGHQAYAPAESAAQTTLPPSPAPAFAPREGPTGARRQPATTTLEIAPRREPTSGAYARIRGEAAKRGIRS